MNHDIYTILGSESRDGFSEAQKNQNVLYTLFQKAVENKTLDMSVDKIYVLCRNITVNHGIKVLNMRKMKLEELKSLNISNEMMEAIMPLLDEMLDSITV